ncbi:hypothetical protein AOLI_G00200920 [Acnodon oligacanthus]
MADLCKTWGVIQKLTTSYHPQTNLTERVNTVLKTMMASYVTENHRDRDKWLFEFRFVRNNARHDTTKNTPAELALGCTLKGPLERLIHYHAVTPNNPSYSLVERQHQLNEEVRRSVRLRQARYYNTRRKDAHFQAGDLVWLRAHHTSKASEHFSAKLVDGPVKVEKKLGPVNCAVMGLRPGDQQDTIPVSNLKCCALDRSQKTSAATTTTFWNYVGSALGRVQEDLLFSNPQKETITFCLMLSAGPVSKGSTNVAVTGVTGTGKSTFINAIRGLKDRDEGAAKTGVTETTTVPTPYGHPTMPNVTFWDLPGIGAPNFKAKTYLKQVQFDRYDFFIIVSSERFRENDLKLAKKIQKRKKLFYFIRSKIDIDIQNAAQFSRRKTLSKIRRNCEENLTQFRNAKVFLISSKRVYAFDFEKLVDTLMSDLPALKYQALLQSLPVSSLHMLEEKVRMFEKAAWAVALLSGGVAAAPVPGLSFACDASILVSFFTRCYYSFGLDDKSLDKLSERVNKPHLRSLITSPLGLALASKSAVRLQLSALAGSALVKNLCKLVPGVGNAAAGVISFTLTCTLLKRGLKDLADTARTVLREAGLE